MNEMNGLDHGESRDLVREELMQDLVKKLKIFSEGKHSRKNSDKKKPSLRIKMEYRGEKRCIEVERNVDRTVPLTVIQNQIVKMHGRPLNMYYTQGGKEVIVAIRGQADLDRAVQMLDRAQSESDSRRTEGEKRKEKSLYMILSKHEGSAATPTYSNSLQPDESGTFTYKVVEVAVSETCSSCGAASSIRGVPPWSAGSNGSTEDWRNSSRTPTVPIHWRKGRCLGRGTFGAVYIAHDTDLSREVVIKVIDIPRGDISARKDIYGLEHDVNALASMRHQRIVHYLGVSKLEECIIIFMEYMVGGTVKDLIKEYGPLTERVAEKYTRQVLEGLAFLHKNDIVHRDIKSANILRDSYGNVKIGDFGSGKRLQALATQNGSTSGTPHYMAPEVIVGRTLIGRKADIWSVGVTLREMVTGNVPYSELDAMEAMLKIAFEEPQTDLPPKVTDRLKELCQCLMAKKPEERPMAQELIDNFQWIVPD